MDAEHERRGSKTIRGSPRCMYECSGGAKGDGSHIFRTERQRESINNKSSGILVTKSLLYVARSVGTPRVAVALQLQLFHIPLAI